MMATKPKQPKPVKEITMTEEMQVQDAAATEEVVVEQTPAQEPTEAAVQDAVPSIDDEIWAKGELCVPIGEQLRKAIGQVAMTYGDVAKANVAELAEVVDRLMLPKPVTQEHGVLAQRKMWAVIQNTLRSQGALFNINLSMVLGLIHEYRESVFADEYVFRFHESLPLSSNELRSFRQVMVLLKEVADPATRKANAKTVRPEVALKGMFDDEVLARLTQYLQPN